MIPLTQLPTLNAILNAVSAVLLVGGYLSIRRRKIEGLLALEGKIHIDLDWQKMEEEELEAMKEHEKQRHGRRR